MYREQALVIVAIMVLAGITGYIGEKFFALSENQIGFMLIAIVISFVVGGIVMNIREPQSSANDNTAQTADKEDVC